MALPRDEGESARTTTDKVDDSTVSCLRVGLQEERYGILDVGNVPDCHAPPVGVTLATPDAISL